MRGKGIFVTYCHAVDLEVFEHISTSSLVHMSIWPIFDLQKKVEGSKNFAYMWYSRINKQK